MTSVRVIVSGGIHRVTRLVEVGRQKA